MRAVLFSLSLFLTCAQAAIPRDGWYFGGIVGPSYTFDLNFNLTNPLTNLPAEGNLSYQQAVNGGGQLGYRYDKLRFEGEILYNKSNFKSLNFGSYVVSTNPGIYGLSFSGYTEFWTGLFNVFYEIYKADQEYKLIPYLGLGGGYGEIYNNISIDRNQSIIYTRNDNAGAPMGQVMIGVSYFFNDIRFVAVDYRYLTTPQHDALNSTISIQSINFLLNFSFA